MNKKIIFVLISILLLITIAILVWYFWPKTKIIPNQNPVNNSNQTENMNNRNTPTVCTQEARQCPDGSYVSRTGPNCEFSECPATTANSSPDIVLGKFVGPDSSISDDELQQSVDAGHQPWRLDPELVIKAYITSAGFSEQDIATLKQISIFASAGISTFEISHSGSTYIITVIQPVPGQGKIWNISEIEKK